MYTVIVFPCLCMIIFFYNVYVSYSSLSHNNILFLKKKVSIEHSTDFYFSSINRRMEIDSILIGSGFDGSY